MSCDKISRAKAEATLAAVRAPYARLLTEQTIDGVTYPALYPEPTLVEDYDGPGWAIVWEEGPDEWAYLVNSGGTSDSDRHLYANVSEEFGVKVEAPSRPAAKVPAGVYVEPHMSFILSVYPA